MVAAPTQGVVMRTWLKAFILGCIFFVSQTAAGGRDYFLPQPTVQKYAVILAGASPEDKYSDQIHGWALRLYDILTKDYGYKPGQIILLMGRVDPGDVRITGVCRREMIQDKMRALKKMLQPGDQVFFFLLGHGTGSEDEAKFVIPGPDITGREFAKILETLSTQDIIVVNTTSASYPFSAALSGPGRVIVASTRSMAERYNTIFAQFFIAALDGHAGDRDKNRRVSMWEAFGFAGQKVKNWYTDQNRIPTEHAVLDDDGDGIFSAEPKPSAGDGRLAQIAYLDLLPSGPDTHGVFSTVDAAGMRNLTAQIRMLERSVTLLRNRKEELGQESYQKEMEALLIELARTSRKLRQMRTESGD